MRHFEFKLNTRFCDQFIPTSNTTRCITHIVIAQTHVDRGQGWYVLSQDFTVFDRGHRIGVILQLVIIINALLHVAPFDAVVECVGRIRRHLLTKQIKGKGIVQVQFLLDRWQVDDAKITNFRDVIWISDPRLVHRI